MPDGWKALDRSLNRLVDIHVEREAYDEAENACLEWLELRLQNLGTDSPGAREVSQKVEQIRTKRKHH